MTAAKDIPCALRALTTGTIIGLLASSGLRVGEALGLDDADVDLDQGCLTIHLAKFDKTRRVPLHPTCVAALRTYVTQRDQLVPRALVPAFFVSARGLECATPTSPTPFATS
jgi:integrase/recombinase XerD